jgi:lipoyl(octanoyl) transferase
MSEPLRVIECGLLSYGEARLLQGRIAEARRRGAVPDTLLLLEHPPTYTRGRRSDPAELPMGTEWYEAQGIEVHDTDRGGRVTYHGPGQLVAYPIISLQPLGDDVHAFVRALERVMIASLAEWDVRARTIEGLTGVWVANNRDTPGSRAEEVSRSGGARKIGSIGIHVSRGVTTHGLAVNVNNDLQPFEWIVPCGIENVRMTSVSRELGVEQDIARFGAAVATRLAAELGRPLARSAEVPASTRQAPPPDRLGALP